MEDKQKYLSYKNNVMLKFLERPNDWNSNKELKDWGWANMSFKIFNMFILFEKIYSLKWKIINKLRVWDTWMEIFRGFKGRHRNQFSEYIYGIIVTCTMVNIFSQNFEIKISHFFEFQFEIF